MVCPHSPHVAYPPKYSNLIQYTASTWHNPHHCVPGGLPAQSPPSVPIIHIHISPPHGVSITTSMYLVVCPHSPHPAYSHPHTHHPCHSQCMPNLTTTTHSISQCIPKHNTHHTTIHSIPQYCTIHTTSQATRCTIMQPHLIPQSLPISNSH